MLPMCTSDLHAGALRDLYRRVNKPRVGGEGAVWGGGLLVNVCASCRVQAPCEVMRVSASAPPRSIAHRFRWRRPSNSLKSQQRHKEAWKQAAQVLRKTGPEGSKGGFSLAGGGGWTQQSSSSRWTHRGLLVERQPEPLDRDEAALPSPLNMHLLPVTPDTRPVL